MIRVVNNDSMKKRFLKRNEKLSKNRFDHISFTLRDRISFLFEFLALAKFFTVKSDTNKEHKRSLTIQKNFKVKKTKST